MSEHPRLSELLAEGNHEEAFAHAEACEPCQVALLEEGAYPYGCRDPRKGYQVLLAIDLLAEAPEKAAASVREHLLACPACHAEVRDARGLLDDLGEVEVAQAVARVAVSLSCVFCHDQLRREEAAFCAACLAPHHPGCFDEHGRCAVLGCEETRTVRPSQASDPVAPAPARRRLPLILAVLASGGLAAAAFFPFEQQPDPMLFSTVNMPSLNPVVAKVGDEDLRLEELEQACNLDPSYQDLPEGDLPARLRVQLRELNVLVEERLLLRLADEKGVALDDAEAARVRAGFAGVSTPLQAYRRDRALDAARIQKTLDVVLGAPTVPAYRLRRYYAAHKRSYTRGGETRIQEIVVYANLEDAQRMPLMVQEQIAGRTNNNTAPRIAWDARDYALRIERTEPWFARPFAECVLRYSMGAETEEQVFETDDLREVLVPPLGELVNGLREGEISPLIECYTGSYHFVKVLRRTAAGTIPFEEVREEIREILAAESRGEERRELLDRLRGRIPVRTFLSFGLTPGDAR